MNKKVIIKWGTEESFLSLHEDIRSAYTDYLRDIINYMEYKTIKESILERFFGIVGDYPDYEVVDECKFSLFMLEHSDKLSKLKFKTE